MQNQYDNCKQNDSTRSQHEINTKSIRSQHETLQSHKENVWGITKRKMQNLKAKHIERVQKLQTNAKS